MTMTLDELFSDPHDKTAALGILATISLANQLGKPVLPEQIREFFGIYDVNDTDRAGSILDVLQSSNYLDGRFRLTERAEDYLELTYKPAASK